MCITYILGLFLILLIAIAIFLLSCYKQSNNPTPTPTIENWSNMDGSDNSQYSSVCPNDNDSSANLYAGCDGFNCPLDKRKTKRAFYDDGYKMEDDRYQCLCKCTRKCNPSPAPTSSSDKANTTKNRMGKRLPFHPWFVPNQ